MHYSDYKGKAMIDKFAFDRTGLGTPLLPNLLQLFVLFFVG
jgi:hypothetical protein